MTATIHTSSSPGGMKEEEESVELAEEGAMEEESSESASKNNNNEEEEEEKEDQDDSARPNGVSKRWEAHAKQKKREQENAAQLSDRKARDAEKRYAYLLGQTDLFSHFIKKAKLKGAEVSALDTAVSTAANSPRKRREGAGASAKAASRRSRKTEEEEDQELLQAEQEEPETAPAIWDETPPYVVFGKMRDYQLQGLNWLISLFENGINGILADEMGLGKTLQTISFLGYLKHFKDLDGPNLIIVPKSTLHNWVTEFKRWVPSLNVFMFHGDKQTRSAIIEEKLLCMKGNYNACVTSYEMCLLEKSALKKVSWNYIVIDEAHRIKNENSSLSQIVRLFQCRNRLLITGTPLQNNLHELWALLNFLLPDIFSSSDDFDKWFLEEKGGDQDQVVKQLQKVLQPFLLRRIKADVEKSLLPKKRINLYVGMSVMQRKWYQKILEKDIEAVNGAISGKKESGKTRLQNVVMQLRKCCNHPYLFDGAEPGPPYTTDEHLVENAGKMAILDRLLERMKAQGSRVLLFSQMSRMLDILEDYCVFRGYEYCRIDGNTDHETRISSIDEFNAPGSSKFIFLLTTRAGGLGINLATADIVVMYDSDWNPQVDLQAEDRAHRIGQKKQVVIFRLITENAIEERVIEKATQKLRLDQLVIQHGRSVQPSKTLSRDDMLSMIQHGADNIFQSTESTISSLDIEEIIARSEKKTAELSDKFGNMGLDDLQRFSTSTMNAYEWEGEDFRANQKNIGMNWIGPSRRDRKGVVYEEARAMAVQINKPIKAPRPPKAVNTFDFQFWPARFLELQEKEKYHYWQSVGYKPMSMDDSLPNAQEWAQSEQRRIDEASPLTEEEEKEKAELASSGFDNWSKRDFSVFCKGCEKYGREAIELIAADVGKVVDEVREYAHMFWENVSKLTDSEKIVASIARGEAKLAKLHQIQRILTEKVSQYKLPLQQMKLAYGQNKGRSYTEEEDRFLVLCMEKFGYTSEDLYERMRLEIKKCPMFRFDWFLRSRTSIELGRRCSTLITVLTKEFDEENKKRKPNLLMNSVPNSSSSSSNPAKKIKA